MSGGTHKMTKDTFYIVEVVVFLIMFILSLFLLAGCATTPPYTGLDVSHVTTFPCYGDSCGKDPS